MAKTIESIKTMIAQLQNVTMDKGASENEAMMAAQKVQDLLLKYHLELNDIEKTDENISKKVVTVEVMTKGKFMWYEKDMISITKEFFPISAYITRKVGVDSTIKILGWEEDCDLYKSLILYSLNIMKKTYKLKSKDKKMDRNTYYKGFITGLRNKLKENMEKNKDKWEIVLSNDEREEAYKKLNIKKASNSGIKPKFKNSVDDFYNGYKEGVRSYEYYTDEKSKKQIT